MNRLDDKVALITGAASGIGRATAIRLAQEGASVFCTDVNEEGLGETVELARGAGAQAEAYSCNLADAEAARASVAACVERFGKLDVLCNIAGVTQMELTEHLDLDKWSTTIAVNLTGTFVMCQAAMPHLLESHGNIINTSSTSALAGMPWMAAYASSKGGVLALTRTLAIEYGKRGVRVNAVCPGAVETPMVAASVIPEGADHKLIKRAMPLDTFRGPDKVAAVVAMLASDDGAHVNGEHIRVDGAMLS